MVYLELFLSFFQIGLLGFGGGYAMIPFFEKAIAAHDWLSLREFADVVAISQMTPGPLAVNAATYIGYRVAGLAGSAMATFAVFLPSFVLVVLTASLYSAFKTSRLVQGILTGIRPATVGLIASAALFFVSLSFLPGLAQLKPAGLRLPELAIFCLILGLSLRFKLNPILAVFLSAGLGMLLV
jgi:chromate transporter